MQKDDFPKARSRMLMKLFECKIQTVSYEISDLCIFFFDEIDPNEMKSMNQTK